MSFISLKQAILDQAETQAAGISATWQEKVDQQKSNLKTKARTIEEEIISNANRQGEAQAKRLHQENQLAAKAAVLKTKQEELNKLQQELADSILAWPPNQAEQLLKSLLSKVPNQGGSITAGALHYDLLKKLVKGSKHELLEKTYPKEGGFIWRSKDQEINVTIKGLVEQIAQANRARFASSLFS